MYPAMSLREEGREVGQPLVPAEALHRMCFLGRVPRIAWQGISRDQAPSVGNGPGAMALTRMLYFAHSTAKEVVMARTAAFAQADGTTNAEPQLAAA